jgi:valyl-tRNA synthetase
VPERYRILTSPVRLTGELHLAHLATLASVDALVRRARAEAQEVSWQAATLAGDLAGQTLVERELLREGNSRAALGREAFVDRVRTHEADARTQVAAQLGALGIEVDLAVDALDTEDPVRAARTAFVRLYEAGQLVREERVVATCPRCQTVLDPADTLASELEADVLTIRLAATDADDVVVDVDVPAPELMPGVVAVAVPEDHPAAGLHVEVPLAATSVPVLAESGCHAPELVVPSHDEVALELARRTGLLPVDVLDTEGVVRTPGPLEGLARFAARAAARELLVAEHAVVGVRPHVEQAARCRRCGTVVVPRRGRHWFLPMGDLEVAAADAIRQDAVAFSPPSAREDLLARAGLGGDWCLSHQVWAGQPVPVASCLDCGQLDVAVEPSPSCGKCMGTLAQTDDVFDTRFIGAVWPLATAGWPAGDGGPAEAGPETTLVVGPPGVVKWALPMAALGLWLAGAVPFGRVAVHHVTTSPDDPDPFVPVDLDALVGAEGPRVLRAALVAGGLDLESAAALVARVDQPPDGDGDVDALVEAYTVAFVAGVPGDVMPVLAATLDAGVNPESADRVRALAAPILGD